MNQPNSAPDLAKDIRIHLAPLVIASDGELKAEMEKLFDWWLENHLIKGWFSSHRKPFSDTCSAYREYRNAIP